LVGYTGEVPFLHDVIRTLREQEPSLRAQGVVRAAVFGSVARGEATNESDIDILVDLDANRRVSVFGLIAIKHHLDDVFGRPVDVVSRRGLKASVQPWVERELVDAF
jgi:predicted nucleotidyltransferase